MTEIDPQQDVKDAVRAAVKSGADVHQQIKDITLKALTERQLDMENIKTVTEAVSDGINEGMASHGEHGKEVFNQAVTALDDALAIAAEASTLAVEEAASKVTEYSQHDLDRAIKDLQNMEGMFLDTLERIAKGSGQVVADIVNDFIAHSKQSGTAVGEQTLIALEALKDLPKISTDMLISSTVAATSALAKIGSGILLGIAESLQSPHSKK
jgi:pheromone shutdown protein TraB